MQRPEQQRGFPAGRPRARKERGATRCAQCEATQAALWWLQVAAALVAQQAACTACWQACDRGTGIYKRSQGGGGGGGVLLCLIDRRSPGDRGWRSPGSCNLLNASKHPCTGKTAFPTTICSVVRLRIERSGHWGREIRGCKLCRRPWGSSSVSVARHEVLSCYRELLRLLRKLPVCVAIAILGGAHTMPPPSLRRARARPD
jgi:hypothetical protein